jgi:hypothetical protein
MTPPSVRRRAPGKVEVTDAAGRLPRVHHGLVHIRGGKKLRIRVVPQDEHQVSTTVSIVPSGALRAVVPAATVKEGSVKIYYSEVRAHFRSQWPLPRRGEIHITMSEQDSPDSLPYNYVIPVAVWPSLVRVLGWGIAGVGAAALSARFFELVRTSSPTQALFNIAQDAGFLGQTLLLGLGASLVIYLAGWSIMRLGLLSGEDA